MYWADQKDDVRVVMLTGAGRNFCAGIDLTDFSSLIMNQGKCEGRKREKLRLLILKLQNCLSAIDECRKPVIASVHGACVGAGVDMVACCDMRYVSADAWFQIKEIDIGMTADVGTLQRLPHIIKDGLMRELAYTGRRVEADEAVTSGLANRVFDDFSALTKGVTDIASEIAGKSPLAIRGTKEMIRYSRDHSVSDSLNYVATWNAGMLLCDDIKEAMLAGMQNRRPEFND
jgi:enoyl-CoA hydratase